MQQVSLGRSWLDNWTCYHTEIEDADQFGYFTQPLCADTGSTNPSADPISAGVRQGSQPLERQCLSHCTTRPGKLGSISVSPVLEADASPLCHRSGELW